MDGIGKHGVESLRRGEEKVAAVVDLQPQARIVEDTVVGEAEVAIRCAEDGRADLND